MRREWFCEPQFCGHLHRPGWHQRSRHSYAHRGRMSTHLSEVEIWMTNNNRWFGIDLFRKWWQEGFCRCGNDQNIQIVILTWNSLHWRQSFSTILIWKSEINWQRLNLNLKKKTFNFQIWWEWEWKCSNKQNQFGDPHPSHCSTDEGL